ncbi:ubiquitin domain-containing protein TINCR-like [Callorhinchus milii]|uniref:ubiquitin domain-containing protein TINCR-like n=1 Tax=Callorhinchus milii TaxID=7868 RepID=UPI001C3F6E9B|nr:ubiquitin domain-containing protein TINCR-like [Callorhinchus milii]
MCEVASVDNGAMMMGFYRSDRIWCPEKGKMAHKVQLEEKLLSHFERHEIQVQLPESGQTVKLKVRPNDNMKHIRVHLVKQGITSWKMVFTYKGKQLGENETLEVKKIRTGSVLMLVKKDVSP